MNGAKGWNDGTEEWVLGGDNAYDSTFTAAFPDLAHKHMA